MRGIPAIREVKDNKGEEERRWQRGGALSMVIYTPVIPELSRGRKEDGEFEASLGYCAHKCLELKTERVKI